VSQILGDNLYLMGNQPCGADATVFAFIAGGLTPVFATPARTKLESMANLVAYRDRMMAEFYPKT
jgi:glutathione S-transferase